MPPNSWVVRSALFNASSTSCAIKPQCVLSLVPKIYLYPRGFKASKNLSYFSPNGIKSFLRFLSEDTVLPEVDLSLTLVPLRTVVQLLVPT
jgi:hypothetical protein